MFNRGRPRLVDHVLHVMRREKLALLDVDRNPSARHGANEIGLAAQKSWGLKHVADCRSGPDLLHFMHVGDHRHTDLGPNVGEDPQALIDAQSPE